MSERIAEIIENIFIDVANRHNKKIVRRLDGIAIKLKHYQIILKNKSDVITVEERNGKQILAVFIDDIDYTSHIVEMLINYFNKRSHFSEK